MSELQRLLNDPRLRAADRPKRDLGAAADPGPGSVLRVVPSPNELAAAPAPQVPPQDWDALIQRVQAAARQSREIELRAREREDRIEEVLERVREDIQAANERARVAEAQAREAQVRAEARVMAAEERARAAEARAQAAEERARHAEEWLVRVQEAITSEFADLTEQVVA